MTEVKWFDANERKPVIDRVVLVEGGVAIWTRDGLTGKCEWRTITGFAWPGSPIQWEVTHWAELPNPPPVKNYWRYSTSRTQEAGMTSADFDIAPGTGLPLDPGIKPYVIALRSAGIETFESCEGGEGHAFPEPTVRFNGGMAEGFKAFGLAMERGLPVFKLRLAYTVQGEVLNGPYWEMVFLNKARV